MMQSRKEDSMSHVDEGTLHAYLDGELPSGERTALEAHIAQCAECRARLVDERALRERASALLGAARPVERPVPSFEQIRHQPKRSLWRVRTPVAWAASIVLALGLGYYLAGVGAYRITPEPTAQTRVATQDRPADAPATDEAEALPRARQEVAQRRRLDARRDVGGAGLATPTGRVDSGALKVALRAETLNYTRPPTSVTAGVRAADSVKLV